MTPELSRPLPADRVGEAREVAIEASSEECAGVARRLGIVAVRSLACDFTLRRNEGGTIQAHGQLRARVRQSCVITTEDVDGDIDEAFDVRFVPEGTESADIDLDAPDEVPYAGGAIDLGEAAVEQLALCLDPFPRKAGATLPDATEDVNVHPFAALRGLRGE